MIDVKDVTKKVKSNGKDITLVEKLSFHIGKGEIVGYIGPNGAGKSTTIKMLCGIIEPTEGSIAINGLNPYRNRIKNGYNIGVIFGQRTQLWWDLPLKDSYDVLRRIYKINDTVYRDRMEYLVNTFGLNALLNSMVRTLSLGERMRADIAAALLHNPSILYLDEPTIGLDYKSKKRMREAISQVNKEYGATIILTTHDFSDIEELCSRIIVLNKGRIIFDGSMDEVDRKFRNSRFAEFESNQSVAKELALNYKLTESEKGGFSIELGENPQIVNENVKVLVSNYPNTSFLVRKPSLEDTIERIITKC